MTTTREQLIDLCSELQITDEEAGEPQWQAYLSERQLADAIVDLRPSSRDEVGAIIPERAIIV